MKLFSCFFYVKTPLTLETIRVKAFSQPQPSHPPKALHVKVLKLLLRTPPLKQKTPLPPLFSGQKISKKIF